MKPVQGGASFVDHLIYFCLAFVMHLCASVYFCLVVTCWERAETGSRRCFFCGSFMLFLSCFCYAFVCDFLLLPCGHVPAGKGLTSWLSLVMFNCEVVTFPLVSWIKCGA